MDSLLSDADSESSLSIAYVHAIAAEAGYLCGEPPGPDRDSMDIQICAGGHMRPKLDIQLKATTKLDLSGPELSFALKIKNYDDLRVDTQTPRILVVLDLPQDRNKWLTVSTSSLVIQNCAYWISLRGRPATPNTASVTIKIPRTNVLDVPKLKELMELSRQGTVT